MENYSKVETITTSSYYDKDGYFHRIDGPAIVHSNGRVEYFIHGKRHREDGPAYFDPISGVAQYFLYDSVCYLPSKDTFFGKRVSNDKEFQQFLKLKTFI